MATDRERQRPAVGELGAVRGTHPPAWSPDDRRIAFATPRAGSLDLHVAASPDAESTPLLDGPCDDLDPRWIAQSHTLLVRHQCPDAAPQDLVVDADTGAILSTLTGLAAWAELSPDGTRALWTEPVPGQRDGDIVVYDLATAQIVERVRGRNPRWRPALGAP
ncbi:MAG: PD40 domain-containing protein [Deltaproteobacteria bacterium]|nr:PD40 domain-containing protein [Deltaproteobacteria bacterium]MBK8714640.1 PD40 domain-containing protein [Deltaproteobacteria bacterium]